MRGAASLPAPSESTAAAYPSLHRRAYLAIFILALVARLTAVLATGPDTSSFGDARAYVFAAKSLVETGRYPDATDFRFFFRPPVYPVFLAAATLGHPDCVPCGRVANAVLGALCPLLLAVLSARIFRRPGVALATGLAAAVHPPFVIASSEIQSEPLFMLLLLAAGFLLLAASDRPSSNLAVLSGAALAAAALTRSSGLVLAPLLLAPMLDRRWPVRARAHLAGSALLGFALALAPWVARNAAVYRELILSSDAAGFAAYCGNSDWTREYYELRSRPEYFAWQAALTGEMRDRLVAAEDASGRRPLSPHERSGLFRGMALDWTREHPSGAVRLLLAKTWHWVRPYPTPWFWSGWIVAVTGALYLALYALAARGALLSARRGVALFCLTVLAVSMAAHVVLVVVWRYRMPYWDPILILYGVAGVAPAAMRGALPRRPLAAVR